MHMCSKKMLKIVNKCLKCAHHPPAALDHPAHHSLLISAAHPSFPSPHPGTTRPPCLPTSPRALVLPPSPRPCFHSSLRPSPHAQITLLLHPSVPITPPPSPHPSHPSRLPTPSRPLRTSLRPRLVHPHLEDVALRPTTCKRSRRLCSCRCSAGSERGGVFTQGTRRQKIGHRGV